MKELFKVPLPRRDVQKIETIKFEVTATERELSVLRKELKKLESQPAPYVNPELSSKGMSILFIYVLIFHC